MDVFMGCWAHAQRHRQRGVGQAAFYASTSTFLRRSSSTWEATMIIATKSTSPKVCVETRDILHPLNIISSIARIFYIFWISFKLSWVLFVEPHYLHHHLHDHDQNYNFQPNACRLSEDGGPGLLLKQILTWEEATDRLCPKPSLDNTFIQSNVNWSMINQHKIR